MRKCKGIDYLDILEPKFKKSQYRVWVVHFHRWIVRTMEWVSLRRWLIRAYQPFRSPLAHAFLDTLHLIRRNRQMLLHPTLLPGRRMVQRENRPSAHNMRLQPQPLLRVLDGDNQTVEAVFRHPLSINSAPRQVFLLVSLIFFFAFFATLWHLKGEFLHIIEVDS
jgi:hypothetical protein